jgi:hypothetical protein
MKTGFSSAAPVASFEREAGLVGASRSLRSGGEKIPRPQDLCEAGAMRLAGALRSHSHTR